MFRPFICAIAVLRTALTSATTGARPSTVAFAGVAKSASMGQNALEAEINEMNRRNCWTMGAMSAVAWTRMAATPETPPVARAALAMGVANAETAARTATATAVMDLKETMAKECGEMRVEAKNEVKGEARRRGRLRPFL